MPLGPEKTEITVQWLFSQENLDDDSVDIMPAVNFSKAVILEDNHISEINQKGMVSIRHKTGTLMPEEYSVYAFHNWVRQQLAE